MIHFEIAQAQNWSFSLLPVKSTNSKPNTEATSSSAESKTPRKVSNLSQPGGSKQNPPRLRPRFAPELDGHFEIAHGQKWRFSFPSTESKTSRKDSNGSSPVGPKQNPPRFAPELDGLHCFESIQIASSLDLSPCLKDRLA
ncbi:hypothetical protein HKD37_06G015710 [Glycine soja]